MKLTLRDHLLEHLEPAARTKALLAEARAKGLTLVTAESCTGGLVAAALTDIPGSSDVFLHGFVTYSNTAKQRWLSVPEADLRRYGAVSEPVVRAMAEGALAAGLGDLSIAVTGIAGPDGGSPDKPVGLVWFATAQRNCATQAHRERFGDLGRVHVRRAAVGVALGLLRARVDQAAAGTP